MLDFCSKHNIVCDIELIPIDKVNEAYERVVKSDVRYRFVIDVANPPADMTGAKCAVSQQGPVWFLAGTDGGLAERTCTIPAGKAILFPIINTESSFEGNPQVKTDEGLRAMVKDFIDKTTVLEVTVDGHKLTDLQKYGAQSPKFTLNYPPDNVVGFPPNTSSQSFTDGYWIILEPLAAGKHEISFKGANSQFTSTGITNFATEARYHLTVK
jgi:hypothetical protein